MTGVYLDGDGSTITVANVLRSAVRWGFDHYRPERSEADLVAASIALVRPMYRQCPRRVQRAWRWGIRRGYAMAREGWWLNGDGEWCC